MDKTAQNLIRAGLEASDYRTCLKKIFESSVKEGKKFNYAAFSRKAGFTSRGFIKEVLDGRKRLTGLSFPKVLKALALPAPLKTYFTLLVWLEEPELNLDKLSQAQIQIKITDLKEKLYRRLQNLTDQEKNQGPFAKALFKSYHVLEVYSALASRDPGTQIHDVQNRTGYTADVCESVLEYLVSQNIVSVNRGSYKTLNPHAVYSSVGGSDGIKNVYLDSLGVLKRRASVRFNGKDQLFSQSFFTVPKHRLPELKKRMREVLGEFIEDFESDDGDCVAKLIVGLYS